MNTINLDRKESFLKAKDLPALIKLFLGERKLHVASLTVKDYSNALNYVLTWWQAVWPAQQWILYKNAFMAFQAWLEASLSREGEGLSANTIGTVFKRIKEMFGWAHNNGYLDCDYSHFTVHPLPGKLLAPVELNRLFRVASESQDTARNKVIMALLIGCDLYRAEYIGLDIDDIHLNKDNHSWQAY